MRTQPLLTQEEVWRRYDAVESHLNARVSERMIELAGLDQGMRVLDLAIGRGEPALRTTRRVGTEGYVLGLDPAGALLEITREKAESEGPSTRELRPADAESSGDIPSAAFLDSSQGTAGPSPPFRADVGLSIQARPDGE